MSDQVRALPKGLPAVSTLIPFLRPVDSLVSGKGRELLEALPTFSGMAGDLLSMAPLVSQECGAPAERLLAAKALGGFLRGVGALVFKSAELSWKLLPHAMRL